MVLAKSKNTVGLGNSLMANRFGGGRGSDRKKAGTGVIRTGPNNETYIINAPKEASWVKMKSVTEQNDLDEFLATAELAGTDFMAIKTDSMKIYHTDQFNPYLLKPDEEQRVAKHQKANRQRLTVPRRPQWDAKTTPAQLTQLEKSSLLDWRRGIAELQESNDLLMTPFERNLEVWRQLWRVIERSDLIVQIVDARNPLLFRCEDLEAYVKEVDKKKENLLLVNKADMMTRSQRLTWATYFKDNHISYQFFSASLAKEAASLLEAEDDVISYDATGNSSSDESDMERPEGRDEKRRAMEKPRGDKTKMSDEKDAWSDVSDHDSEDEEPEETKILTVDELEALFLQHAPQREQTADSTRSTTIGLVGYPNVGKSSTINALLGAKKVSVSSTPGKTKHFQTIHLSESVILCDCPGLVFPNFAFTKAELVCSGVLPIDQQREFTGPAALVAQRLPQANLEKLYGIKIETRPSEEGGNGIPTASELLSAYAKARGFATTNKGNPDQSRAARRILKDYVSGRLLFCHPPPVEPAIDPLKFNEELYQAPLESAADDELSIDGDALDDEAHENGLLVASSNPSLSKPVPKPGQKTADLDRRFFGTEGRNAGHVTAPPHRRTTDSGKVLTGRKEKQMVALEKGVKVSELGGQKKHFKGNKRRGMQSEDA